MPSSRSSGLDLNLLRVLAAILEHGSVTRAAAALGSSQPVVSKQLATLRLWYGDPLLVRRSGAWTLTNRALAIVPELRAIFSQLDATLGADPPHAFDPERPREIRILTADYSTIVLVPRLIDDLAETRVRLRLVPWKLQWSEALVSADVDLVLAPVVARADASIRRRHILQDGFVLLARDRHPLLQARLTLARFAGCDFVQVAPDERQGSLVDDALARRGHERLVRVTTSTFGALPQLLANSDLLAVVPARVAAVLAQAGRLAAVRLPMRLPGFGLDVFWHTRSTRDAAVRHVVALIAKSTGGPHARSLRDIATHDPARRRRGTL